MSKRSQPSVGRCVHCLAENVKRNWDHVFPKSWYPDSTPPNMSKWIMPTCIPCNSNYGAMEQDMLIRLACCVDPSTAAAAGIYQKVLRSMDPHYASNEKDARIRWARRNKILSEMMHGDEIPNQAIYPGLGERWSRPRQKQVALAIPVESFRLLTEKIVRGIYYIEDNFFIEPPHIVEFYPASDSAKSIADVLDRFGTEYARGPGIIVRRAVAPEDNVSSLISIEVWKSFTMYASVR